MLTSPYRRTVSLRHARAARAFSWACVLVCLAADLIALAIGHPFLLVFPSIGLVLSACRARRWHKAIRKALTSPDAMRWP